MTTTAQIARTGVEAGKSTAQIIAENPGHKASSISRMATRARKEFGLSGRIVPGPAMQLTRPIHEALQHEIEARGLHQSANMLALTILAIIVKDDLFNAILGDA